ncbi:MAG: neutral/alkaline non-lysosomal ceramidase N-terminal domain-containing protein [Oscillospiraceae bacterium]|nr:neutral/alkaline non-lysosomal ceramidase N-terminal domain-containing protein [Oscillospiraceae bacterium]
MKCGFYEMDITPKLGSIIPGGFAARYAENVQEPLFARAFVAETEQSALAVVVVDACGITEDITLRVRERVAQLTPIPAENVMLIATHCHGGGPTLNWGEEVVTDPEYLTLLVNRAADSIALAYFRAEESELVKGREELYGVAFIRDYLMKDGTYKTNPSRNEPEKIERPCTELDPEVLVIGVRQGGKQIGTIVNFANHPAIVAKSNISSDYIHYLSEGMKKEFGQEHVTVFINGALGNVNHFNPFDLETYQPGRHIIVGERLAEAAIAALRSAQPMKENSLACASSRITVRFRKPSLEYLEAAKQTLESWGDDLINRTPKTPEYTKVFYAMQAFRFMADKRTQRELPLQLMRVGDVYIAGTPIQMYTEFGKAIKKGLPSAAMVSAFANDYAGYVPTPDLIGQPGIYEARLCPTSALEADTGDAVVQGIIDLQAAL